MLVFDGQTISLFLQEPGTIDGVINQCAVADWINLFSLLLYQKA